jgi:hypothetical protein
MSSTETSLPNLLAAVRALPRSEKLRLIQLLAADLEQEESSALLKAGATYPIWTPLDAHEAAAVLLNELAKDRVTP